MNKKGFTLIELLGTVVILAILLSLAANTYIKYLNNSRKKAFDLAVNSLEDATASAFENCESGSINTNIKADDNTNTNGFCDKYKMPNVGESVTVQLDDLITYHYIDTIKSPYKTDEPCTGSTTVKRKSVEAYRYKLNEATGEYEKSSSSMGVDGSIIDFCYKTCLVCGNKESEGCNKNPDCWE